jgi:hypothetical protein
VVQRSDFSRRSLAAALDSFLPARVFFLRGTVGLAAFNIAHPAVSRKMMFSKRKAKMMVAVTWGGGSWTIFGAKG